MSQHDPYDFIMSDKQKPKRAGLSLPSNKSQGQRIAIVAGGGVVLLLFLFMLASLLSGGGESKDIFLKIVQKQTELVRVASLGSSEASASQSIKNTAMNTQIAVTSDRQILIAALATEGIAFKEKELVGVADPSTDKRLADARTAANFNSTIVAVINEHIVDYQTALQQTYDQTKTKTLKDALAREYQNTESLKKQIDATKP